MDGDHGLMQKLCLFEPSVAVPLIVSYPGRVPQGKVSRALAEYAGIYERDPGEFHNRADDPAFRAIRRQMHERLVGWYNPARNPYRPG